MNNDEFLRTAIEKLQKDAQFAIQAAGIRMLETARERTPRAGQRYATGALGNSLRIDLSVPGKAILFAGVPHAIYMEYGTGPKGAQSWESPVVDAEGNTIEQSMPSYHGGRVYRFSKKTGQMYEVNTQGMPAHPFMRPALQAGIDELKKAMAALNENALI